MTGCAGTPWFHLRTWTNYLQLPRKGQQLLVSGTSDTNISIFSISKVMHQVANGDHNDTWDIGGKGYAMAVAKFVANCTGTDSLINSQGAATAATTP